MNDLIQMEMTLEEARETDRLLKRHINTTRYLLLDMRDRKGWKALGYESFKDYGEKSLGYEKAYLTRLADAGEISLQLGYDPELPIGNSPPESQLRPLKAVPEDERKAIWEEATRKAEEEHARLTAQRVEDAVAEWKQRQQESQAESNERRKQIRELETRLDEEKFRVGSLQLRLEHAEKEINERAAIPVPEPEKVEVPPSDYDALKQTERDLRIELGELRQRQRDLVQQQVVAKLAERQKEIDDLESKARTAQHHLDALKRQIDGYSSQERELEVHLEENERARVALARLAANMAGWEGMVKPEAERLKWAALADMMEQGAAAIRHFVGDAKLALTVISGGAA